MLTNSFLHKYVLPCVCISGPPHRLLWRKKKEKALYVQFTQFTAYAQAVMILTKDALTFSYNPKDLKFIHHITDVRNLHQVKRW